MPTGPDLIQEPKRVTISKPACPKERRMNQPKNATKRKERTRASRNTTIQGPAPNATAAKHNLSPLNHCMRMTQLPLPHLHNRQRLQPIQTPLTPNGTSSPIRLDSASRLRKAQRLKEFHIDVDIVFSAALAGIDNLDIPDRFLVVGVVDADVGAAEGVVVWVGGVVHFVFGDGYDGLAGSGAHGAGGVCCVPGGVVGQVAGVGGGDGDGDGEGEDGESEGAGFHFCGGGWVGVVWSVVGIVIGEKSWNVLGDILESGWL